MPKPMWLPRDGSGKPLFKDPHSPEFYKTATPCGKCIGCRIHHAQTTAVRIMHEAQMHERKCSLTLTYDDNHVQTNLDYNDIQKFLKRLRNYLWRNYEIKIRFYVTGEYGSKSERIHWHMIVFGYDFLKDRKHYKTSPGGQPMFKSAILDEIWGMGDCSIQNVTQQAANYVAAYVTKKVSEYKLGPQQVIDIRTGEILERIPEFAKWSLKPTIGHSWIEKFHTDILNTQELRINGIIAPMPKYYKKWLDKNHTVDYSNMVDKQIVHSYKHQHENTPEMLAMRERLLKRKQELKKRNL